MPILAYQTLAYQGIFRFAITPRFAPRRCPVPGRGADAEVSAAHPPRTRGPRATLRDGRLHPATSGCIQPPAARSALRGRRSRRGARPGPRRTESGAPDRTARDAARDANRRAGSSPPGSRRVASRSPDAPMSARPSPVPPTSPPRRGCVARRARAADQGEASSAPRVGASRRRIGRRHGMKWRHWRMAAQAAIRRPWLGMRLRDRSACPFASRTGSETTSC